MNILVTKLINKTHKDNNRIFVAEDGKGDYGFITDQMGQVCVSFWPHPHGSGMNFATCHKSIAGVNCGTGDLIAENRCDMDNIPTNHFLMRNNVPSTAHRPVSMTEHLKEYKCCNHKEIL